MNINKKKYKSGKKTIDLTFINFFIEEKEEINATTCYFCCLTYGECLYMMMLYSRIEMNVDGECIINLYLSS